MRSEDMRANLAGQAAVASLAVDSRNMFRKCSHKLFNGELFVAPSELMFFRKDHRPSLRERLWLGGQMRRIELDQSAEVALGEFNAAFEQLRAGELILEDGMLWAEDGRGRCIARRVHPEQVAAGWLGLATERRRRIKGDADGLQAFQLVASDISGFMPWERGYDESVRIRQPALYEPDDSAALQSAAT